MPATKTTEATFTADDIARLRDDEQNSWAKVATALGLGSPGAARRAYTALVRPHTESVLEGRSRSESNMTPVHLDGADLEAIRDLITERTIIVERANGMEDIFIARVTSLKGDTVNINDGNKSRSVKVSSVIGVR